MRSNGELKIQKILFANGVAFSTEYILGAKGFSQVPLRYDFHLTQYHGKEILIEFQGEEHYKFIPFFHKTHADFQKRQIYDEKKISYALAQNIDLYCIPYWDIDQINSLTDLFKPEYLAQTKSHNYIAYEKYQKSLNQNS